MQVDTTGLAMAIRRLKKVPGMSARPIIKEETNRLLRQIIRFTPPKNQAQGRNAIEGDFKKAFVLPVAPGPLNTEDGQMVKSKFQPFNRIKNEKLALRIGRAIKRRDYIGFNAILSKMRGWKKWDAIPLNKEFHKRLRNRRGRVRKSAKTFTLDRGEWRARLNTLQGRTGWMKQSWGPGYYAVGGSLPRWISRHGKASGGVVNMIGTDNPSITVRNSAPGISQLEHIVRSAIKTRTGAINRRIKGAMRALARKAVR